MFMIITFLLARHALPLDHNIWIHAAKLEESEQKGYELVKTVLSRGIRTLQKNGVKIIRDDWLNEAMVAEKSDNPLTCKAIIEITIGENLEQVLFKIIVIFYFYKIYDSI